MKRPRTSTLERQTREKTVSRSFKTITPVAGSINVVLWKTRYYAVIVLPLGDFGSIGLTGSIWETGLWKDCPKGYSCNENPRIIYRNQKYEESGRSQQYPVKYFGRRAAPVWYGWIEAQHLKPLKEFYEGKLVQNYFVAMQFSAGRETSQAYISATIEPRNSTTQAACRVKSRGCAIDRSKRQREVDGDDAGNDGGDDDDDAGDSNYANEDESSVTDDDYAPSENESDKQARKRLKGGPVVCPTQRRSYAHTAATVPSHLRAGGQRQAAVCRRGLVLQQPSRLKQAPAMCWQLTEGLKYVMRRALSRIHTIDLHQLASMWICATCNRCGLKRAKQQAGVCLEERVEHHTQSSLEASTTYQMSTKRLLKAPNLQSQIFPAMLKGQRGSLLVDTAIATS